MLVTQDASTRLQVSSLLQRGRYGVVAVGELAEAWSLQRRVRPDLIVVQSRLASALLADTEPARPALPLVPAIVLMEDWRDAAQLTALPEVVDYVTNPVAPQELLARIAINLRRSTRQATSRGKAPAVVCGNVIIDVDGRSVSVAGQEVSLTALQFDLLHFLAINRNRPLSRDNLLDAVWGLMSEAGPAAVTVQMRRLREQIEAEPSRPRHLRTVWGVGYQLDCEPCREDDTAI